MFPRLNSFGSFMTKANRKVQWIDTSKGNPGAADASWQPDGKLAGSDSPHQTGSIPRTIEVVGVDAGARLPATPPTRPPTASTPAV
jgi:hypothetical protein